MLLPSSIRSKASLIFSSGMVWVMRSSMLIFFSMYQSTIFGTSVRPLDDVEPDAAEPEHRDVGAGPDLRGVHHGADPGGDAAADVADLLERRVLADLGERDLRQHREVRERRAAHVVKHVVAVAAEA